MTECKVVCCKQLLKELQCAQCHSVLLYTLDGYAYYGRIEKFIDHNIAVLTAGAGQSHVIIRHPDQTFCPQGSSIIREEFTLLDLGKVVAATVALSSLPNDCIIS